MLVCDLLNSRVLRYYLKGPKRGQHDVFIDNLPGLPDNLNSDGVGNVIVSLVLPVDGKNVLVPQMLGQFPLIRKLISRILALVEGGFKLVDRLYPCELAKKGVHWVCLSWFRELN